MQNNDPLNLSAEEKKYLLEMFGDVVKKSATNVMITELKNKGFKDETIKRLINNAMDVTQLWLMRYVVDHTTKKERDVLGESAKVLTPIQVFNLLSIIIQKKTGQSLSDVAEKAWQRTVDAVLSDVDTILEEASKAM